MKKFLISAFFILMCFSSCAFGACNYKIVRDSDGVYVIRVNTSKIMGGNLIPYTVDELETNRSVYDKLNPEFIVNAGFFDQKNKKTVSYVVIDGNIVLDPKNNENLMSNEVLKPYMDKILNRSEFRIYSNEKGKLIYDIVPHNEAIPEGCVLKHSIQGGPGLVPDLRLEEEFFILVRDGKIISESASSLHKYARTAIGIKENNVYIFIVTNDSPMTLKELAESAEKLGMEKAMAFDGGGSTSFDSDELHIISEKDNQARKLKSFLMLK